MFTKLKLWICRKEIAALEKRLELECERANKNECIHSMFLAKLSAKVGPIRIPDTGVGILAKIDDLFRQIKASDNKTSDALWDLYRGERIDRAIGINLYSENWLA